MERQEIKGKMMTMKSRMELLDLLNIIKLEEEGDSSRPFTLAQLSYFCNPKNPKRFKVFTIPKKTGGEREISAPVKVLRSMLHYLNVILSSMYNPKNCVTGFAENKSVVDNARMHIRQNYILNIDLSDFFPSIEQARVWKRLQVKPYNLSRNISSAIAGLCSIEYRNLDGSVKYVLPQGAPTSPLLSNMICERLDYKLTKVAKDFGLNYSRYADDMTFSSMHNVYQKEGKFMNALKRIIEEENFKMNEKKTRLQKRGGHQEVTGLNVTSHVNITRKYVNWIRTILHIWEKYGYQEAYSNFYPNYIRESGHKHKGEPDLVNVMSGKLMYMKMVKGESDSTYTKLKDRFDVLVEAIGPTPPDINSIKYKFSYTLWAFEKKYCTLIELNQDGEKFFFGFSIEGKWQTVEISKEIDPDKLQVYLKKLHSRTKGQKVKGHYYISLCSGRDLHLNKNNHFWLITNIKPKVIEGVTNISTGKLLSVYKKEGVNAAMALLSEQRKINTDNHANDKNHTPHAMVSALYKFSQHNIIKWFTHRPDSNSIDVKTLLDMTKKALYGELLAGDRHEIINKFTWNNIKYFVLHENDSCRPVNAYNKPICLAWGDDAVRKWCDEHPGEHPYHANIDGKRFMSSILEFKHAIEFRTDMDDMTFRMRIKEWVDHLAVKGGLDVEYQERFIELEPVQLFIDVRLIFASIRKIMTWIAENRNKGNCVSVDVDNQDEYVELIITHIGSHLSMEGKKRDGLDGDFEELRLMLLSVADLRMEADHYDGKSYSIICLDKGYQAKNYNISKNVPAHMKTPCKWTELGGKVGGVLYFIKMYKNI